tara:strand:- start:478 stop:762 length:285 start_codon:yes stop_codon:yes gene_type:complete
MPIIKYTLDDGNKPSGITDGGYYYDPRDDTYIGIGSGGGTELTKAEFVTRMQSFSDCINWTPPMSQNNWVGDPDLTEAEYEAKVNEWCSARGIS